MTPPSIPVASQQAFSPTTSPYSNSLLDVQGLPDTRGIALQQAGVKAVEMPITLLQKNGLTQTVAALATMSVSLPAHDKGTHMSRFVMQLAEWSKERVLSLNLREFLAEMQVRLKAPSARVSLDFRYFVERPSPVSDYSAPMGYACQLAASLSETGHYSATLGLTVPIATLCPCSKAISKYGAHNQRAEVRARLALDTFADHPMLWFEDLVDLFEACASCPVYPILKRSDEKYVTERAYENPKFVEDVIRDAIAALRLLPGIRGFDLEVEALESIHAHNAWATHREGDGWLDASSV
jgi:GTP cyclohydrolase I